LRNWHFYSKENCYFRQRISFLETIKEYLRLNANTNSNDRKQKVLSSPEELAQVLSHDTELGVFTDENSSTIWRNTA
jgi:hypothetical protein